MKRQAKMTDKAKIKELENTLRADKKLRREIFTSLQKNSEVLVVEIAEMQRKLSIM